MPPRADGLLLVSWNVAGRRARLGEQAAALAGLGADVVCLQEVTPGTLPAWREALRAQGHRDVLSSLDAWIPGEEPPEGRRLGIVIAARAGAEPFSGPLVPWQERLLAARLRGPWPLEVIGLHSPISQKPGLVKVRTHVAVHAWLAGAPSAARVLCGDLNTPRREFPDGSAWTFARTASGRLRADRGERWDEAELALIRGLEPLGWKDAWRAVHGDAHHEPSWAAPRGRTAYRLDHVLASPGVATADCGYLHEARETGLSDHAPVWARLGPEPNRAEI